MAREPNALRAYFVKRGWLERDATRADLAEVAGSLYKRNAFQAAMATNRRVAFDYTRKRDGATLHYVAAPYSRRSNYLYATESKHGDDQIHSFILPRIKGVEIRPQREFSPRWPTEPESV